MKSGYCYCDIKSFVPQVVCMALVGIWFSDHKSKNLNSKLFKISYHFRGKQKIETEDHRGSRNAESENQALSD